MRKEQASTLTTVGIHSEHRPAAVVPMSDQCGPTENPGRKHATRAHTRSLAIEETDAQALKDDHHGWKDARQPLMSAAKRLAISTGQLNTSLCLHLPPIDLVVFQGPSSRTNSTH